jgi:prolyl-tRNA synthetase
VIRPTSETIIYAMFAKWVQSYRDLPLLINQWANVVRWEMRTRLFLRTTEFLWQEGHTAHVSEEEAEEETRRMLGVYREFMEEWMAMPVVTGRKSESEKFAGALRTYTCEAMMQDNKALQAGTSHNLGQNFSRQFELLFQTPRGARSTPGTPAGASPPAGRRAGDDARRRPGAGDAAALAPIQVVIVPIYRKDEERERVVGKAKERDRGAAAGMRTHIDDREKMSPGAKFYEWETKGVPFRIEVGPKDMEKEQLVLARRVSRRARSARSSSPRPRCSSHCPRASRVPGLPPRARARGARRTRTAVSPSTPGSRRSWRARAASSTPAGAAARRARTGSRRRPRPPSAASPTRSSARSRAGDCLVCGEAAVAEVVWAKAY